MHLSQFPDADAWNMLKAGATILEIMQRLGHTIIAATSRSLNSLASAENRLTPAILDVMGFTGERDPFIALLGHRLQNGWGAAQRGLW